VLGVNFFQAGDPANHTRKNAAKGKKKKKK
jgi:hypothetical protein